MIVVTLTLQVDDDYEVACVRLASASFLALSHTSQVGEVILPPMSIFLRRIHFTSR